jgi:hypothetical protein
MTHRWSQAQYLVSTGFVQAYPAPFVVVDHLSVEQAVVSGLESGSLEEQIRILLQA